MYHHYKVIGKLEDGRRVSDVFYSKCDEAAKRDFLDCYRHQDFVVLFVEQLEDSYYDWC